MSFSDQPTQIGWQTIGCLAYLMATFVLCFVAWVIVAFDGWDEPPMPRWLSLLIFPGSVVLTIVGGVALIKFFARDKD